MKFGVLKTVTLTDNVKFGMKARKGRVHDIFLVSKLIEKQHASVRWMKAKDVDALFGLSSSRAVS